MFSSFFGKSKRYGDQPTISPAPVNESSLSGVPAELTQPSIGVRLGNFILEELIGAGGMGQVWKARHAETRELFALKLLPAIVATHPDAWEQVLENFQLIRILNHQHIGPVQLLERDPTWGPYLVMTYIPGITLSRYRRMKGQFAPEDVVRILEPVAAALDYAHGLKVIHRDVKHDNILLTLAGDGTTLTGVYVIDFGLAAQVRSTVSRFSQVTVTAAGTRPYMAPEIWKSRPPVAASDQYALGVIAYDLFSGSLPFDGDDVAVLREAVLNDSPESIPGLPPALQQTLQRVLAKTADQRFANCREFIAALRGVTPTPPMVTPVTQSTAAPPPASPPVATTPPFRVELVGRQKYATLAEAVQAARSGDRILLDEGPHTGGLTITINLEIASRDPHRPATVSATNQPVFVAEGNVRLALRGLLIQGEADAAHSGIYAVRSNRAALSLTQCQLSGLGSGCVSLTDAAQCELLNCEFHDAQQGVSCHQCAQLVIRDCVFRHLQEMAVHAFHSQSVLSGLQIEHCRRGINLSSVDVRPSKATLTNLRIRFCKDGLRLSGNDGREGSRFELSDVSVQDCEEFGISLSSCIATVLRADVLRCMFGLSLMSGGSANVQVQDSSFQECLRYGLSLSDGAFRVRNTIISRNNKHGINMTDGEGLVEGCRIADNAENGISISGLCTVRGCEIIGNAKYGVSFVTPKRGTSIESCLITGNRRPWLLLSEAEALVRLRNNRT